MTAKDFELIARVLKASREPITDDRLDQLADAMAEALRATNKQFNRDKFIRACGGTP